MWQSVETKSTLVRIGSRHSRTISQKIFVGKLDISPLTAAESDKWSIRLATVNLDVGDIANLGDFQDLGRNRELAPAHLQGALRAWLASQGITALPCDAEAVPLACVGAGFHHDANSYPDRVFGVLWLGDNTPWDLYFPFTGVRVPLEYGTVVLFDSAQPHGVVPHGDDVFDASKIDYVTGIFLSQDLDLNRQVERVMGITRCSRKGKRGFQMLNQEGFREELDEETGDWSIKEIKSSKRNAAKPLTL